MKAVTRFIIRVISILTILGIIGLTLFTFYVHGFHLPKEVKLGSNKLNATWMAHEWVGEFQNRERIHSLVTSLMKDRISLTFVHTGPIESNGTIPKSRYSYATNFLSHANTIVPELMIHAWIGQVRSKLDLEDEAVRAEVVKTSVSLIRDTGFDGVHLNIEPMQSDPYFLTLTQEIHDAFSSIKTTRGNNPHISVAVTPIVPALPLKLLQTFNDGEFLGKDINKSFNSVGFVSSLSEYADMIVLMAYDTGFKDANLYKWFLEQELIFALKAAPEKVLIGIPTYEDERENFDAEVENIENALDGIHNGLSNIRTNHNNLLGLALYSRWTIDEAEWITWRREWLYNDK